MVRGHPQTETLQQHDFACITHIKTIFSLEMFGDADPQMIYQDVKATTSTI
jgi:hypothetical protein